MPNPVAPGSPGYNLLCLPGIAGVLHGDFDRSGIVDHSDADRNKRLLRPGTIILANLDIDDPLPSASPPAPPPDLNAHLDATKDVQINGGNDVDELTLFKVRKPNPCNVTAQRVFLQVKPEDAVRIRIFQVDTGAPGTWPVRIGPGTTEYELPNASLPWAFDFRLEALTLPGDPTKPAPAGSSPNKPDPYSAQLPPGSSGSPIYSTRAPAEVWIELVHANSPGPVTSPYDVGVFTIAPFLLLSNLQPAQRAYAVYFPDSNHNFMYDLAEACQAAFGAAAVTLPSDTSTPFTPHTPVHLGPLYIVDGSRFPDEWIQDELEIGYCWAPHAWMHVVLHCKRNRPLSDFIHQELPGPGMGLFDALHGSPRDGQDFGGNLEVSPPVSAATPALPQDNAGPSVPAHRPAPLGKIILGDCAPRPVHDEFREFLLAQKVQPILPLDTSWLAVGHVDEFLSFVPANSGKKFKLLIASVHAMNVLLEEAVKVPVANGRTNFRRGQWLDSRDGPPPWSMYEEISVEDLLGPTRTFNDTLRTDKLIPIERRLRRGLNLNASDIVRVPIYFEDPAVLTAVFGTPASQTVAKTVGMVNMLVVNRHLMVPKPFGPRLREADAKAVLRRALDRLGHTGVPVKTPPATGFWFWAHPGEEVDRLAAYFTHPSTAAERQNIIDHITTGTPLSPGNTALVTTTKALILADPKNAGMPGSGSFAWWRRVWIPESTVDLLEAYMISVLEPLGLTVHFIDDWFYHAGMGEVHCGTNAKREPPELSTGVRWWDTYDPEYDTRYDPAS